MTKLAEWACLGILVADGEAHGWSIARRLRPDADIGRVWQVSRAVTYRSLDALAATGWIEAIGDEVGDGPPRTILAATDPGRRAFDRWLDTPVGHLRDLRSALLLKLVFADRVDHPTGDLLRTQLAVIDAAVEGLVGGAEPDDLVARWRIESARAARRFVADQLGVAVDRRWSTRRVVPPATVFVRWRDA